VVTLAQVPHAWPVRMEVGTPHRHRHHRHSTAPQNRAGVLLDRVRASTRPTRSTGIWPTVVGLATAALTSNAVPDTRFLDQAACSADPARSNIFINLLCTIVVSPVGLVLNTRSSVSSPSVSLLSHGFDTRHRSAEPVLLLFWVVKHRLLQNRHQHRHILLSLPV
jgi:hypothetical protein